MVEKGKKGKILVQHVEGLSEMLGITPKWDKDHPKMDAEEYVKELIKGDDRLKDLEVVTIPIGPKTKEEQERYDRIESIIDRIPFKFTIMTRDEAFAKGFKTENN